MSALRLTDRALGASAHLSLLLFPLLNAVTLVVTAGLWIYARRRCSDARPDCAEALNWIASAFVYSLPCIAAAAFGFLWPLYLLGALCLLLPLAGSLASLSGKHWRYPSLLRPFRA